MSDNLALFDFDDQQEAVLMPSHDGPFHFHNKAIFPFLSETEIVQFVQDYNGKQIGIFETITKSFPVYECDFQDELVTVAQAPLGAPAATQFLDFLIYFGVKQIISVGSCGVLTDIPENEFLLPTIALRDEGTSFHYVPKSDVIKLNQQTIEKIEKSLISQHLRFHEVKTWTIDGFFRETPKLIQKRKLQGCEVVEMECAALAACAQFRHVVFGQVFFTADSLANVKNYHERDWVAAAHEKALILAANLVKSF
ncbi:nucleoside phosphorylase [Pediococcus ethanolidurans]|uniref:nucleoside phosphorylase n=1 Tax=Pediococcus ethanolidurans TaxID=319653 RepID=UPI001C1EC656|nr:nucleoside phosphorylase [Pediococcus ethanolidurans]MBU7555909.1 nucleoside phosphorylase [Pediococcus ethanolidurans]MCT4398551.1 phosphorylase [Pediococcus ethanolidurans]MCV3315326.1 nucleoside phosphorylase [Pediococcus ethanolidurans]MCV3321434.1 nucleoside phosphorylase [Pediococcus ethanolidurans]MCV3323910.1 nucleoside phosphorylase [Pediococcus ethanolidurans]